MSTLTELITRTADRLSMVAGTGVQTYADDRIAEMIQHKFDVLFLEEFWPQFLHRDTLTLDGTLGVVTADLTEVLKDIKDIRVIFPTDSNIPLKKLSALTSNPNLLTGTRPMFYEAVGTLVDNKVEKVFQVWPKTATGTIEILLRVKPATFGPEDEIDFDDQALILGATFDYLEDDGTNPNATQKFQGLFDVRVNQLKDALNDGPISLSPHSSRSTNTFELA